MKKSSQVQANEKEKTKNMANPFSWFFNDCTNNHDRRRLYLTFTFPVHFLKPPFKCTKF